MNTSRNRARAIAIARTRDDSLVFAFRLSLITVGAVAALLAFAL
ncbi:hypothetical protein [Agrobacterium larrymoorei]|nr:hypothetical protein [Agrobacterium larrymoorei]